MTREDAKQLLKGMGFEVVEGEMVIQFGDYESREPVIAVKVSSAHECFDSECKGVHLIGTETAIKLMSDRALLATVTEDLVSNR